MIITTAKILHSTILKISLFTALLLLTLFFTLTYGITLQEITLPNIKIEKFYIKLDKKLIIIIDQIKIQKKKQSNGTLQEVNKIAQLIQALPHYFQKIDIHDFIIGEKHFHLYYHYDTFYVDTDTLELSSHIFYNIEKREIIANIDKLYIKAPQLTLKGQFTYHIPNKIWKGHATYHAFGLDGHINLHSKDHLIQFSIDSNTAPSIKALVDYIAPPEPIKVWIYPKIPAQRYKLHYLKGEIQLSQDGSLRFDPTKLQAFATAYDAKIHFHSDLPPVSTRQIDIRLKDDTLSFKLYDPTYEGKKLQGSSVQIRNLTNRHAELDAHIVVKDRIDQSIQKLLSAYEIHLPFVQTEGKTNAVVDLTIRLIDGKVTSYQGVYHTPYAKLLFDETIPLPVRNLHVISKDSKITIKPCDVSFAPYFDATLQGQIDLDKKVGSFSPFIHRLEYSYGSLPLLMMKREKLPITMSFDKNVTFSLPSLALSLTYQTGGDLHIKANYLALFKPYFQSILLPIQQGEIHASFRPQHLFINGTLHYTNNILIKDQKPIERFQFQVHQHSGLTHVTINQNIVLNISSKESKLKLENMNIDIDHLLKYINTYLPNHKAKSVSTIPYKLSIEGNHSTLFYQKLQLPSLSYHAVIQPTPFSMTFTTHHHRGEIQGVIKDNQLVITGKDLSDKIIKGLTTLSYLHGGSFSFNAKGHIDNFQGTILIQDTLWTKNALYNNILAMLNTIPAVLLLKDPGFNKKGFKVQRGVIQYHFQTPTLTFENIVLQGHSANITGKGHINFQADTIALHMQIHFLESLTTILNKIPIAGYLIFGDDGSMAITLNIHGSLYNPKVETEATKDLVKAPLNILERTLTLPFKLFE